MAHPPVSKDLNKEHHRDTGGYPEMDFLYEEDGEIDAFDEDFISEIIFRDTGKREPSTERKGRGYEERTAGMDANAEITQQFTEIAETIPEERREEALQLLREFAETTKHQPPKPLPADQAAMKAMKIETYREYKKRTGSTDGRACLKANWKDYLKAFRPALDRDYMCQADLARLDRKLLERLRHTTTAEELGTFLPSLKDFNRQQVAAMSEKEIKEAYRKKNLVNRHLDAA